MLLNSFYNSSFFVIRSVSIKNSDIFYKLGLFKGPNFGISGGVSRFFKGRFLVSLMSSKLTLVNFRLIRGFGSQFFSSILRFYKNQFGLKNDKRIFNYFDSSRSSNDWFVSYFLVYSTGSAVSKSVAVGFLGKNFLYFRALVSDIFNFFGPNVYDGLYLDYFDFNAVFAFDLAFPDSKDFYSIFKVKGLSISEKFMSIRNIFTFFKIFLVLTVHN